MSRFNRELLDEDIKRFELHVSQKYGVCVSLGVVGITDRSIGDLFNEVDVVYRKEFGVIAVDLKCSSKLWHQVMFRGFFAVIAHGYGYSDEAIGAIVGKGRVSMYHCRRTTELMLDTKNKKYVHYWKIIENEITIKPINNEQRKK